MDFDLSEDQKMLRKTVRDFASSTSTVERFRKLRDADGIGWDKATWAQMGELGWLAVPFAEEAGGFGGNFVEASIVLGELGTSLVPEPYLASVCLAGSALALAGSSEQQAAFLAPMMEGQTSLAFANYERRTRYGTRFETTALAEGDGYVLNGEKTFVLNGHAADAIVVSASLNGEPALFVVRADDAGLERDTVRHFDGRRGANLRFANVRLGADRRLEGADAAKTIAHVLDMGAAASVAEAVGVTKTMLAMTLDYLKTREQFDVKIGSFQALQHRAVDMFVESELLQSIAIEASVLVNEAESSARTESIAAAKHQLATGGMFIARQSIQLHGGIGVTDEADIGLFFKRLHVLDTVGGDGDHHVRRAMG